ncbi:MAG: type II toxin-antitoxin system RelE/ParE family toxin [Gammaproteobacteria bacterium]|nr:type II toxin-antitoxin system RelE/ParE family toxin [Gammaproteobacteria bacterium]
MKIRFMEEAQVELDDAMEFYQNERHGLGQIFLQEILNVLERIANFPQAWHPLSDNTRRCQTRRFPYGVIYSVFQDEVLIIAVSHLHRKPNHWQDRLN